MARRYFQVPVFRSEAERNAALYRFWGRWWVPIVFIAVGLSLVSFPAIYAGRGLDPSAYRIPIIAAVLTPPLLVLFGLAVGNRLVRAALGHQRQDLLRVELAGTQIAAPWCPSVPS